MRHSRSLNAHRRDTDLFFRHPDLTAGRNLTVDYTYCDTIEAACSHDDLLREEVVKARVEAATQVAERAPNDQAVQQEQQRSRQCQEIFKACQAARRSHGKSSEALRISGSEPEAMVQHLKRSREFAASYKPSVLANEDRIIMALALDASSETQMIALDARSKRTCDWHAGRRSAARCRILRR